MVIFLIIVFIVLLLLLVFLFTKITIKATVKHDAKTETELIIKALFGLLKFKIHFPKKQTDSSENKNDNTSNEKLSDQLNLDEKEKEALKPLNDVQDIFNHVPQLYKIVKKVLKKVEVKAFEWQTIIGTGDAASTGVISGVGWSIKGSVIGIISYYFTLKKYPKLVITPNFNRAAIHTHLFCIFQMRIGYAILAGIKLFLYWRKNLSKSKTVEKQKEIPSETN